MGKYNSPTGGGRYLEFTPEIGQQIIDKYQDTLVLMVIAGLVGRSPDTIKRWINRAFDDHEAGKDTELSQFYVGVKAARAQKINELEKRLVACEKNWQALAWYLERTTRQEYGLNADLDAQIVELNRKLDDIAKHKEAQHGGKEMDQGSDQTPGSAAQGNGHSEG